MCERYMYLPQILKAGSASEQTYLVFKQGAKGESRNLAFMSDGIALLRSERMSASRVSICLVMLHSSITQLGLRQLHELFF